MDKLKKCIKCEKKKKVAYFSKNSREKDGLHYYCKSCVKPVKQEELTIQEARLLLKYLPYVHEKSKFICEYPKGNNAETSHHVTIEDLAVQNDMAYHEVRTSMYKFTRMGFVTMITKGVDGKTEVNILYNTDKIKSYFYL